jgi:hypothetical protein
MATAWKKITGEMKRKVLVTNNLKARDAHGQMSHIWCVGMVHKTDQPGFEPFMAFDNSDRRLWGLTHYAEIPK